MNYWDFFLSSAFCLFVCLCAGKLLFEKKLQSHSFLICKLMRKIRSFISSVITQDILARTQWNLFLSFFFLYAILFWTNFCRGLKCRALKWIFMIHRWMEIFWNFIGRDFTLNLPPFQMEFEIDWLALFYSLSISTFL